MADSVKHRIVEKALQAGVQIVARSPDGLDNRSTGITVSVPRGASSPATYIITSAHGVLSEPLKTANARPNGVLVNGEYHFPVYDRDNNLGFARLTSYAAKSACFEHDVEAARPGTDLAVLTLIDRDRDPKLHATLQARFSDLEPKSWDLRLKPYARAEFRHLSKAEQGLFIMTGYPGDTVERAEGFFFRDSKKSDSGLYNYELTKAVSSPSMRSGFSGGGIVPVPPGSAEAVRNAVAPRTVPVAVYSVGGKTEDRDYNDMLSADSYSVGTAIPIGPAIRKIDEAERLAKAGKRLSVGPDTPKCETIGAQAWAETIGPLDVITSESVAERMEKSLKQFVSEMPVPSLVSPAQAAEVPPGKPKAERRR